MNKYLIYMIFVLFVVIFYIYFYDGTVKMKSPVDGKYYKVRNNNRKQIKADTIAIIHLRLNTLVTALKNDTSVNTQENIKRLIKNWDSGISIKEIGNMESDAGYVINKQYMSLCLEKSPYGGELEPINMLIYVAIHELAHIMSHEIGHGDEFINNFTFLLDYSKKLYYFDPLENQNVSIYTSINRVSSSDKICGVYIKNSIH